LFGEPVLVRSASVAIGRAIGRFVVMAVPAVSAVSPVPAVHKDMQQRAGEQDQPWEPPEEMRPMFGDQIKPGDREKGDRDDAGP
jgi:hypothetical protein